MNPQITQMDADKEDLETYAINRAAMVVLRKSATSADGLNLFIRRLRRWTQKLSGTGLAASRQRPKFRFSLCSLAKTWYPRTNKPAG